MEKSCEHSTSFFFDSINLILAGNEDMYASLDEFKFRPDTTTNSRDICPCTSEKLMYNVVNTLARTFSIGSSSFLHVTRTTIKYRTSSKSDQIRPWTAQLAALESLEKSPYTYNGRNLVNTLAPSSLIGSASFLQVTRKCIKAWMSSNFGKIPPQITELAALGRLKNHCIIL